MRLLDYLLAKLDVIPDPHTQPERQEEDLKDLQEHARKQEEKVRHAAREIREHGVRDISEKQFMENVLGLEWDDENEG